MPTPEQPERPVNPFKGGQGLPLQIRLGSGLVRNELGQIDATRFMCVLTGRAEGDVHAIQERLKELTTTAAMNRADAMALVCGELKNPPWNK